MLGSFTNLCDWTSLERKPCIWPGSANQHKQHALYHHHDLMSPRQPDNNLKTNKHRGFTHIPKLSTSPKQIGTLPSHKPRKEFTDRSLLTAQRSTLHIPSTYTNIPNTKKKIMHRNIAIAVIFVCIIVFAILLYIALNICCATMIRKQWAAKKAAKSEGGNGGEAAPTAA